MPSSPKEFREFAEECLRRADETKIGTASQRLAKLGHNLGAICTAART